MEVKFSNEQEIFKAVYHAVNNALLSRSRIRTVNPADSMKNPFTFDKPNAPEMEYRQQSIHHEKSARPEAFTAEIAVMNEIRHVEQATERNAIRPEAASIRPDTVYEPPYPGDDSGTSKVFEKREIFGEKEAFHEEVPREKEGAPGKEAPQDTEKYSGMEATGNQGKDESTNEIGRLKDARVIGQAFNTYILLQLQDQLILMDQHAAHERVVYEDLKERVKNRLSISQTLLAGQVVELAGREIELLNEEKEVFLTLGFDFEPFGSNSIILRAAPVPEHGNPRECSWNSWIIC
jgi:DNA mismatch repair enzyme (predicted ATPase)